MPEWSLSKMRPVDWLAVAIIAVLFFGAAYLFLGLGFTKMRRLHQEQTQLAQELEVLTSISNTVMEAQALVQDLQLQQDRLAKLVPYSMNFGGFYGALTSAATEAHVLLEQVQPGTLNQAESYLVLPVDLAARGGFQHLYDFIFRLTHLPRLTKVEELSLLATEDPGVCTLTMTLHVYAALPGAAR